jgi:hypothetical protein
MERSLSTADIQSLDINRQRFFDDRRKKNKDRRKGFCFMDPSVDRRKNHKDRRR